MAPSPSPEHHDEPGTLLLDVAEGSLRDAFRGAPLTIPSLDDVPAELRATRGAFVSLHVDGHLNGCIGTIEGEEPLVRQVARLARSAAFDDPRLPALRPEDLTHLEIEVSVLSPLRAVPGHRRAELTGALRPGVDGVLIAAGRARGVFLPTVWAQLPEPDRFVDHLLAKAMLPPGRWPPDLQAWRFTTTSWTRTLDAHAPIDS